MWAGFGKPDYEVAAHYWIIAVGLFFVGPGTLVAGRPDFPPPERRAVRAMSTGR